MAGGLELCVTELETRLLILLKSEFGVATVTSAVILKVEDAAWASCQNKNIEGMTSARRPFLFWAPFPSLSN